MEENYLSVAQAIDKYDLNLSRLQYAIRLSKTNGLYKAMFRNRSRLFFRQDYFEEWLATNDVSSPPRRKKSSLRTIRSKTLPHRGAGLY